MRHGLDLHIYVLTSKYLFIINKNVIAVHSTRLFPGEMQITYKRTNWAFIFIICSTNSSLFQSKRKYIAKKLFEMLTYFQTSSYLIFLEGKEKLGTLPPRISEHACSLMYKFFYMSKKKSKASCTKVCRKSFKLGGILGIIYLFRALFWCKVNEMVWCAKFKLDSQY